MKYELAAAAAWTVGERDLQLGQNDLRRTDDRRRGRGQGQLAVRAGGDDDRVLPAVVDRDDRRTGRGVRGRDQGEVDAGAAEGVPEQGTAVVVAERGDHRRACTGPRGRDRLVGALAARPSGHDVPRAPFRRGAGSAGPGAPGPRSRCPRRQPQAPPPGHLHSPSCQLGDRDLVHPRKARGDPVRKWCGPLCRNSAHRRQTPHRRSRRPSRCPTHPSPRDRPRWRSPGQSARRRVSAVLLTACTQCRSPYSACRASSASSSSTSSRASPNRTARAIAPSARTTSRPASGHFASASPAPARRPTSRRPTARRRHRRRCGSAGRRPGEPRPRPGGHRDAPSRTRRSRICAPIHSRNGLPTSAARAGSTPSEGCGRRPARR